MGKRGVEKVAVTVDRGLDVALICALAHSAVPMVEGKDI